MISYLGMMLAPLISTMKAWLILLVFVVTIAYVGFLHVQLNEYKELVNKSRALLEECQDNYRASEAREQINRQNIVRLKQYYDRRKCLRLSDGELSDEELSLGLDVE